MCARLSIFFTCQKAAKVASKIPLSKRWSHAIYFTCGDDKLREIAELRISLDDDDEESEPASG